ncbi:MAG: arsenate reductase (glutaredoxin) [Flavobacteriaceae bacterium]
MYTIYHNPRCRKSREALQYLEDQGAALKIVNYLNEPLKKAELKAILNQIGQHPSEIVRKNEADWKAVPNRNELTEDQILEVLVEFPKTIERPIVTSNNKGVLARPLENLISFITEH